MKISSNVRATQPLGDRQVYASFNTTDLVSPVNALPRHRQRFNKAFDSYWEQIQSIRGSIQSAYGRVQRARRALVESLRNMV